MKHLSIIFLVVIILASQYHSLAQDTFDNIKISIGTSTPKIFLEGQTIYYDYIIENTSSVQKNYEKHNPAYVEKITDIQTGQEAKRHKRLPNWYYHHKPPIEDNSVKHPFSPYYRKEGSSYLDFSFGNKNLKEYLNIPEEEASRYNWLPDFFKPGLYEITLAFDLTPTTNKIRTTFQIEVLSSTRYDRIDMLDYFEELYYIIKNSPYLGEEFIESEEANPMWVSLKNNKNSQYAQERFQVLAIEYEIGGILSSYRSNPQVVYRLFEIMPKLQNFRSVFIGSAFVKSNTAYVELFQQKGLISNAHIYLDGYLKKIEHLDPQISKDLIFTCKFYYNSDQLRNYAQERVEREIK